MGGPSSVYQARPPEPGAARIAPGFFESIGLGFEQAGAGPDWGINQARWNGRIREDIEKALKAKGHQLQPWDAAQAEVARRRTRKGLGPWGTDVLVKEQAFFDALARERQLNPEFMKEYADVHDWGSLVEVAERKREEEFGRLSTSLEGGSAVGQFVGAVGHGFQDPSSYIPVGGPAKLGLGPLRQILSVGAREAAANVAITAVQEPLVRQDAPRIGIERTLGDTATDIGVAAVTGGLIGGGVEGGRLAIGALKGDRAIVNDFRATVPEENWTPDERAIVNVLEREADISETTPLHGGPANDEAHARLFEDGYRRAVSGVQPPAPKRIARGELLAGTADPGLFRFPAREQFKARVRQAESGGSDVARNPRSSASGRYQFTMGTWVALYRQRYGKAGQASDIWGKRFDPHLQEVLMDDLTSLNARALREAGRPETAGNLYLMHFAGEHGGLKVLAADPAARVGDVLGGKVVAANPFLKDMTAGDLVAWADRKMGGPGQPVTRIAEGSALPEPIEIERAVRVVEDRDARADWADLVDRPVLRAELFGTPEEHASAQVALWREHDDADGFAQLVDDPPPAVPIVSIAETRVRTRSGPEHVMRTIAEAGGLLDTEGHDLVRGRGIPKFMLGAGAIIRPAGTSGARGIDAIGELLHERGYFGPPATTPRPKESEIIELIERAAREKVYAPDVSLEQVERSAAWLQRAEEEDVRFELAETARQSGMDLDGPTLEDALARRARGESIEGSISQAIEAATWRDAPAAAGLERFDEPDGEGADMQIDSLEHDLRMAMEAGDDGLYRLSDEGEEVTLAQIFEELDEDVRAAQVLRECMVPRAAE